MAVLAALIDFIITVLCRVMPWAGFCPSSPNTSTTSVPSTSLWPTPAPSSQTTTPMTTATPTRINCPDEDLLLPLQQENPQMCEFYEVCISPGDGIAQDMVKSIDDSLYCGVSGIFAGCSSVSSSSSSSSLRAAAATGCHGQLFDGATGPISDVKWDQLCQLAQNEVVVNAGITFGCGYWLS